VQGCTQSRGSAMNIPADLPEWMLWFYGAWCALILFFKWWFK